MSLVGFASAEAFDPKSVCDGVTLTVAVAENTRISDWNENEMTRYIEDKLGVNLEFEVYPKADFFSKVNAMVMAGDELPDLIIFPSSDNTSYLNWAKQGALKELSDYYADPNLSANITAANEGAGYDIATYMKNGDNQIYALPRLEQGIGMQSTQRFWIYQPWLDEMGVGVPATIDEYYDVCKYVSEHDMNGNGDTTDEYALMGYGFDDADTNWGDWFEPLMRAVVDAWDPNFAVVNDGQVSFAYTTDAWKEGLKYIKKFFDEGLIGTELFTNTIDDCKANLYAEGPLCLSFTGWQWEGDDLKIKNNYTYVDGLKGPDGQEGYSDYMPILPSAGAVISADSKNPEAAFLVCDLMGCEYLSLITRYGEEGVNWAYWDTVLSGNVLNPEEYAAQGGDDYPIDWVSAYADTPSGLPPTRRTSAGCRPVRLSVRPRCRRCAPCRSPLRTRKTS
jgi:putative aldouronate transport system substrate-binding protein